MIVTYRCKCGNVFDGHWDQNEKRIKQFPHLGLETSPLAAMTCPQCGNRDYKKNIDSDESFRPSDGEEETSFDTDSIPIT